LVVSAVQTGVAWPIETNRIVENPARKAQYLVSAIFWEGVENFNIKPDRKQPIHCTYTGDLS
jgi:hypothetical protein